MTFKFSALLCGLLISSAAMAQDYGLTVGVHQTTADYSSSTGSSKNSSGTLGYDAGLTASFELVPSWRFRTGVLYDVRPFELTLPNQANVNDKTKFNFAYLDVPVNVQYNFNPTFGVYGGLVVGIKAGDSTSGAPDGYSSEMKSLIPFANAGVNLMFNDMIGFDFYVEKGLGEFAKDLKNYSTVGMHFIYWL
ncbi:MAG: outer membrane beta-barrel protein [Bdellovibrionales bacterium]